VRVLRPSFAQRTFARARLRRANTESLFLVLREQRIGTKQLKNVSTMVFPVAAAAARRRVGMIAKQQVQRRNMAGHSAAPEWEGIDKIVRGVFPGDHQRA
jgi:hypothetical protein